MKWEVLHLRTLPKQGDRDDIVVAVSWRVSLLRGVTEVTLANDAFTEYKDLTEEQILGWVWAQTSKETWEAKAADLAAVIPPPETVVKPLPWESKE